MRRVASVEGCNLGNNKCTIVAVTSYTGKDVKEKALGIGIKKVINKPLQANVLKEIME